jgi:hypothetical protein
MTPEDEEFARIEAEINRRQGDASQPAPVQEPVAWVPYLSDRADGVQGHYAIARWNPRGYREVWNLRRHAWGAFSDDVMSLEEADYLLQQITIPTRKPTPPAPQPVPVKNYHDGKPWPVAPMPWVGLTEEEIEDTFQTSAGYCGDDFQCFARAIEAKVKEKNAALPPMHASGLVAIKTLLERDTEAHAALVIDMIEEMLGENT